MYIVYRGCKMKTERCMYQGLSFPKPLLVKVRKHIREHKEYHSVTEFFREAVIYQMKLDSTSQLDKADILLKELDSLKKSRREMRKEIKYINKQGTIEEKNHLEKTSHALDQHMDAKHKKEEEWDREYFEYQLTHGASPYHIKETRKNLIRKYKQQMKAIPGWLSDTIEEPTIQLSKSKLNEILQRIEKLEKKKSS